MTRHAILMPIPELDLAAKLLDAAISCMHIQFIVLRRPIETAILSGP